MRERIAADGAEPMATTPEEYAADIDREETKWSEDREAVGREGGVTVVPGRVRSTGARTRKHKYDISLGSWLWIPGSGLRPAPEWLVKSRCSTKSLWPLRS